MSSSANSHSPQQISKFETTLAGYDGRLTSLSQRMGNLESENKLIINKLDMLSQAITGLVAQPRYEVGKILDVVLKGAALLSILAAAIVFVANGQYGAELERIKGEQRLLQYKLEVSTKLAGKF